MQPAHRPAVLSLGLVTTIEQRLPVPLNLGNRKQPLATLIVGNGRNIMIQESPASRAVLTAGEIYLERVVSGDTHPSPSPVAKQGFHLGGPLGMRCPAETEAM